MCTICTLKSVSCLNGILNNISTLILLYWWFTDLRAWIVPLIKSVGTQSSWKRYWLERVKGRQRFPHIDNKEYSVILKCVRSVNICVWLEVRGIRCLTSQSTLFQLYIRRHIDVQADWVELNWLFNVTINDISVIYVRAHRCAGGLKKEVGPTVGLRTP